MNLEKVLKDLHAEKRWLESLIGALETASSSPAHRLIRGLDQSLWHSRRARGLRFGPQKKSELARLAQLVGRNGHRRVRL